LNYQEGKILSVSILPNFISIDWNLKTLFDREILNVCSDNAEIVIGEHYSIAKGAGTFKLIDKIEVIYKEDYKELPVYTNQKIPIVLSRRARSFSDDKGRIKLFLENTLRENIRIRVEQFFEWHMTTWLHSIKFINEHDNKPIDRKQLNARISFTNAIMRKRGSQLRIEMELPPLSKIRIEMDYELSLLKYTEYPVDPHRGLDIR
jgi:hypothetical protein